MSLWSNLKKRGLKDILRPKKWGMFIRYVKARLRIGVSGDNQMEAWRKEYPHLSERVYLEQIVYRMSQPGCQPCIAKGECIHCGCKSPELFFEKDNECSGMNWFEMLLPDAWEEFKQMNGIVIDPKDIEQVRKTGRLWQN